MERRPTQTSTIVIGCFLELVLSTICIFVYYSYTIMILNIYIIYIYTPWICLTICYSQFAVGTSQYQVWWPMFWSSSGQVGWMSIPPPAIWGTERVPRVPGFWHPSHPSHVALWQIWVPQQQSNGGFFDVPHDNWDMIGIVSSIVGTKPSNTLWQSNLARVDDCAINNLEFSLIGLIARGYH